MTSPVPVDDPRVPFLAEVLDELWSVEVDVFPSVEFEAQSVLGAMDRWERENAVPRPTDELVAGLEEKLARTQGALLAAVCAFDSPSAGEDRFGGVTFWSSVAIPAETVETWRQLAEGGV